ncbi:hypothetical protein, partial [Salmonella sp. SAL4434]|uniref:hypothetical protein n=1 Tax=Salmonella sp. SAL4434 TaxID=3159889 RepID=UPI003979E730
NEPAARRFDKLRRLRAQLRDELCVRSRPFRGTDDVLHPGEMGGDVETSQWSRTRLVRSLSEGAELPAPVAEEIAAAVEQKIFG